LTTTGRRLHAIIRGRVQGVGFRATTQQAGRKLGLSGWVRNGADGTVEVEAEGDEATLKTFLEYLNTGPLGAHVDAVTVDWLTVPSKSSPEQGGPAASFEVRRTQ